VNFGFLYRLFAISQQIGNCVVENCVCVGKSAYGVSCPA
jgi:hypothetical protein